MTMTSGEPARPLAVLSQEHYAQLVAAAPPDRVVVLNFWADWARPSADMNLVVADLAEKHPGVTFLNIEAEAVPDVSLSFDIAAVPSFVILRGGKELQRIDGANSRGLAEAVAKYAKQQVASLPAVAAPQSNPAKPDVTARLKQLVNAAPVMLFMKGTPSEPRCGFSRKIVDLLNGQEVRYSSFNILADEEVRQALKEYSNWPTYPQLYINGELVGGLDIAEQLIQSGEFKQMIPAEPDLNSRLKVLVNRDKVMVFIKGSPTEPRCGFSKQLLNILDEQRVKFSYFDILSDEEVRQGLKDYAGWPTYPMVFAKGGLVGGLDIVKEMVQTGEFARVVSAAIEA